MRVIAGSARRTQLKTLEGMDTRPTTDRIKETLFNMIAPYLYDSIFLDLFAGSGGIGHWSAGFVPHGRHCVRGLFGRIPLHSRPWTSPRLAALSDSFIDRRLS